MIKDIQLYALNFITLAVSFTKIENSLKIVLLLITIGYSIDKWIAIRKKRKNGKD
jgi:hypothetical protein